MKAVIYCRVSSTNQDQEHDGTSLQTQLENCLKYCQDKGYDVSCCFSETYSGLSLERPEIDKVRELVRNESIEVLVCYSLDRLTRDPNHGVIITQELEKHHVALEAVTEDVSTSELGKLITYIRGFASKLEAEKIRERTMRGKRAAKEAGRIYCGTGPGVYGYDYLKRVKGERQASRIVNETEAAWVCKMYDWLANEGISTNAITLRLRAWGAPTKASKVWGKSSVSRILKNPAYAGRTNATPAIISPELFDAAQNQLKVNSARSPRNCKHEYLLRGHIRCRRCGQAYSGEPSKGKYYYRCLGRRRISLNAQCHNKVWRADLLEAKVWNELVSYFSKRELILGKIDGQKKQAGQLDVFKTELELTERQLKALDQQQRQLLHSATMGEFEPEQIRAESGRINKAKETLKARLTELQGQVKASQDAAVNVSGLEHFINDIQDRLPGLDFAGKRLTLEWLGITAWIDGENVEVTGIIEPKKDVCIATTTI